MAGEAAALTVGRGWRLLLVLLVFLLRRRRSLALLALLLLGRPLRGVLLGLVAVLELLLLALVLLLLRLNLGLVLAREVLAVAGGATLRRGLPLGRGGLRRLLALLLLLPLWLLLLLAVLGSRLPLRGGTAGARRLQLALMGLLQASALLCLLRLQGLALLLVLALQVGAGGTGALLRRRRRGRPLDDRRLEDRQLVAAHLGAAGRRARLDRGHLQPFDSPAGHLLDVLHRDALVDDAVVDHRVVGDVGGVMDDRHVARRWFDVGDDVLRQERALLDEAEMRGPEGNFEVDAAESEPEAGAEADLGRQWRPTDVAAAIAPGNPGRTPFVARDPLPAVVGVIGPAAIVIGGPTEGLVGHPGPAVVGHHPAAGHVGAPAGADPERQPDPAVGAALDPVAVGRELVVEVIDVDAATLVIGVLIGRLSIVRRHRRIGIGRLVLIRWLVLIRRRWLVLIRRRLLLIRRRRILRLGIQRAGVAGEAEQGQQRDMLGVHGSHLEFRSRRQIGTFGFRKEVDPAMTALVGNLYQGSCPTPAMPLFDPYLDSQVAENKRVVAFKAHGVASPLAPPAKSE